MSIPLLKDLPSCIIILILLLILLLIIILIIILLLIIIIILLIILNMIIIIAESEICQLADIQESIQRMREGELVSNFFWKNL